MRTFIKLLKNRIFEISTILCFILPPVGILLLFVLSFFTIIKTWKDKQFHFSIVSFFFVCLLVSTIGAVIQMRNPLLFIDSLMILGYLGIYLRIVSTSSIDSFRNFTWIMIFGGLYNCVIGWAAHLLKGYPILELLMGTKLIAESTPKNYSRLIGSAYNPNFTMHLLLIALTFLLAEILTNIRKKQWVAVSWQFPILLILSNGVLATGSRAGFLIMLCIYFIFFLRLNKVAFLLSAAFTFLQSKSLLQLMPRNDTIDGSFQIREDIWLNSIELWNQHFLFGTTPHGFRIAYDSLFNQGVPHAHNIFIGFFVEYGVIGGLAFLIFLCATLYNMINLMIYNDKNKRFVEYFLLSLPVIFLTGMLDEPTFSPQIAILSIMLLSYWDQYMEKHVKVYPIQDIAYQILYKKKHYSKY